MLPPDPPPSAGGCPQSRWPCVNKQWPPPPATKSRHSNVESEQHGKPSVRKRVGEQARRKGEEGGRGGKEGPRRGRGEWKRGEVWEVWEVKNEWAPALDGCEEGLLRANDATRPDDAQPRNRFVRRQPVVLLTSHQRGNKSPEREQLLENNFVTTAAHTSPAPAVIPPLHLRLRRPRALAAARSSRCVCNNASSTGEHCCGGEVPTCMARRDALCPHAARSTQHAARGRGARSKRATNKARGRGSGGHLDHPDGDEAACAAEARLAVYGYEPRLGVAEV